MRTSSIQRRSGLFRIGTLPRAGAEGRCAHYFAASGASAASTGAAPRDIEEDRMKTKAAIAYAAGKPLEVVDGRSRRPESRRGAGRDQGERRLPHRRVHALGRRSGGAVPRHPRPRGRGSRRRRRAGRHHAEEGRSRHSALHAGVPAVQILPVAQDEPLHRHPRDPGQGRDARRHQPLLHRQGRWSITTWAARRSRTTPCCRRSRSRRSARTRRSRRSATSAAASPPASAPSSTRRRSSRARTSSSSASAASASTSSRARASSAPTRSSASTSTRAARRSPRSSA